MDLDDQQSNESYEYINDSNALEDDFFKLDELE